MVIVSYSIILSKTNFLNHKTVRLCLKDHLQNKKNKLHGLSISLCIFVCKIFCKPMIFLSIMHQGIRKLWYLILCVIEVSVYRKLRHLNYIIPAQYTPSLLFIVSILFYIAHFKNKKYHRYLSYMSFNDLLF